MGQLNSYFDTLAAIANVFTIVASGLAVIVFAANRNKLSAALKLLLNFSFQTTLTELKEKVERLNEYNANEPDDLAEIRNILHEIAGQIRGNVRLREAIPQLATKIEMLAQSKKLSEPSKRSVVSEIREQIRGIQINNIDH